MAKITVCIPTYNRASMLQECLGALCQQTFDKSLFQIIISDNASEDNTGAIIKQFVDLPIQYFRNDTNLGFKENMQKVVSASQTEYTLLLCDDDWLTPGYLQRAVTYLDQHPDVVMYGGDASLHACFGGNVVAPIMRPLLVETRLPLSAEGVLWTQTEMLAMCAVHTPLFLGASMFRTEPFQKEWLTISQLDIYFSPEKVLYSRLLEYGDVFYDGWVGACIRWHPENGTHKYTKQSRDSDLRYSTLQVLGVAYAKGIDIPLFWHNVLLKADQQLRQYLANNIVASGSFTQAEVVAMLKGDWATLENLQADVESVKNDANAEQFLKQAWEAFDNNDCEKAGDIFLTGLEKYPRSIKLWIGAGQMAHKLNDYTTARAMAKKALELYPNSAEARKLLTLVN